LPVRYEDLVDNPKKELKRILNHLEIEYTGQKFLEAIEKNNFKNLSGGRSPGEEDPKSHYRKGVSGEWKEVFDSKELRIICEQISDYLDLLGYPIDQI
jgi:hypothetical protein